ncbi:trigger factor [Blautia sp. MSJ-36]|uniref:trigger factor n=1 Tax=Blautia sp. MSJ-36 TaxID=2841530 RepID=UPI001C12858D|nr:trigger factor [Blautia sp. MSJ-36]MBU5447416.1 trigger factor [Blautia sp. MSJ-36]
MKKKTYLVILALCAAMAMTACGTSAGQKEETKSTAESQDTADEKDSKAADSAESDSDKESTGTVSGDTRLVSVDDVSKYVTIGQYKGLSLDKTVEAVTDDMVDGRIKEELQNKAEEVTEGNVQNGDVVTINYVGTKDGVAFDGGTANNYELTIGSGTFIDGFEDGIIGMKKGQTKDLDLTFPEEYSSEELAGQEVVFKVTLQSFKRAPELTDDWAAKNTDCKTAEEYRKEIRTTLEDEAKTSAQNTLRETAWNTVLSASEVKEYPQDDLDTAKTEFKTLYENYAKQGDMTLEDFVKAQGISMDDFEEQSSQYAEYKVKQNLIVQGIMDAENMTLEDEKSLSIQDELIKAYNVKDLAALVDKYGQAAVDESIGLLRVEDFILDNATVEEKVTAGDTEGVNGDDPSEDGSSAEGTVDEELEAAEATDMVPEE